MHFKEGHPRQSNCVISPYTVDSCTQWVPIFYNKEHTPFPIFWTLEISKSITLVYLRRHWKRSIGVQFYSSSDFNDDSLARFLYIFNRVSNKHEPLKSVKVTSIISKLTIDNFGTKTASEKWVTDNTKHGCLSVI